LGLLALMSDLEGEIVALRVSGLTEPEICAQLGCTLARVRSALDASAARMFDGP
jgi:DNA-binding CsgD family transcriptional regulator